MLTGGRQRADVAPSAVLAGVLPCCGSGPLATLVGELPGSYSCTITGTTGTVTGNVPVVG